MPDNPQLKELKVSLIHEIIRNKLESIGENYYTNLKTAIENNIFNRSAYIDVSITNQEVDYKATKLWWEIESRCLF